MINKKCYFSSREASLIKIKNVFKSYQLGKTKVEAINDLSLNIAAGQMVCLMGPSGSGKSTLLNLIGCLDQPDQGSISIAGLETTHLKRRQLAAIRSKTISFIFQSFNLIPVLNIYENIELPLLINQEKITSKQKKERINALIKEVGLTDFIRHRPDELSGGQRQRVAIARALVTKPQLVLADEPTANLDSITAQTILNLMKKINQDDKTTFLFATHDPAISGFATQLVKMKDGKLKEG
jgi:putative ABC transport system ATP-binding protein